MSSVYHKTEGLVLRKMPFGEADFLVRILTREFGKMDALAKGARKSASKLNPHLDILNFIRISFVQNGERLPTLTDAEIIERFDNVFSDANRIAIAGRMLKSVDTLVYGGEPDSDLLDIALVLLRSLNHAREPIDGGAKDMTNVEDIGNRFARAFLKHQGYGETADFSLLPQEVADTIMNAWPNLMI